MIRQSQHTRSGSTSSSSSSASQNSHRRRPQPQQQQPSAWSNPLFPHQNSRMQKKLSVPSVPIDPGFENQPPLEMNRQTSTSSSASSKSTSSSAAHRTPVPQTKQNHHQPQHDQQQQPRKKPAHRGGKRHRNGRANGRPKRNRSRHEQPQPGHAVAPFLLPEEAQVQSTMLSKLLEQRGCVPTPTDTQNRLQALEELQVILNTWCSKLWVASNKGENNASSNHWQQPRVALISFGSYRLQVHQPESSDLDVLALSPPFCSRGDFFSSLVSLLRENPHVEDIHPIGSAFTPVLKMEMHGIHIDLLFTRLQDSEKLLEFQQQNPRQATAMLFTQPSSVSGESSSLEDEKSPSMPTLKMKAARPEYQIDDSDLLGLDEASVRSLNGARVSQLLLEMVPDLESYRVTLRAVKEWATVHGVYSNVLGFLGGINYAILVAWICMRHPNHPPTTLLRLFFRSFCMWNWPAAVTLVPVQLTPPAGVTPLPVWNPKTNPRDGHHLMPIITPAYPSMNSSYNVGPPQLRRMQEEFARAATILEQGEQHWDKLYNKSDFFYRHSNFLQITIRSANGLEFPQWQRYCESRLRLLISAIDTDQINAWPFARFFDKYHNACGCACESSVSTPEGLRESYFYIALRFAPKIESVNLRYCTYDFLQTINSWDKRTEGMDMGIAHVTRDDIPEFVLEAMENDDNLSHSSVTSDAVSGSEKDEDNAETKPSKSNQSERASQEDTQAPGGDASAPSRDQEENQTGLTPKIARSTLSEEDIMTSPSKKARN